jgi:hypothetical protein
LEVKAERLHFRFFGLVDTERGTVYVRALMKTMGHTERPLAAPPKARRATYCGSVVYAFAYDVAYELNREPVDELLGQKVVPFEFDSSRRHPRHHSFCKPSMIKLPAVERMGPDGPVQLERMVKILPIGAISITVRLPFAVDRLEDLVRFHDLQFEGGSLGLEVRVLAEAVRKELEPLSHRPVSQLADEEAYTVFCLEAPLLGPDGQILPAEEWFRDHRREIAALLTQENNVRALSRQEGEESTARYLSYYQNDLVVVDWDAALLVDERADFDESLYVMELANLQLAELEAYDKMLDESLERSYRDMSFRKSGKRGQILQDLREIRIDMARFGDELMNITKFFGDWHLARLYQHLAARFHLSEWHQTVEEKLKTLGELYELLKHDQNNRWMLILESTIVLLFIIDLVILFLGLSR